MISVPASRSISPTISSVYFFSAKIASVPGKGVYIMVRRGVRCLIDPVLLEWSQNRNQLCPTLFCRPYGTWFHFLVTEPSACALGCILSPLCGLVNAA